MVTFNQVTDVNVLHDKGNLIPEDWNTRLPNNASPYYSTTAFLVRKGNPKNIQGWADLAKDGVDVVFPNPKTSGNGRYTYLAAWMAAGGASTSASSCWSCCAAKLGSAWNEPKKGYVCASRASRPHF